MPESHSQTYPWTTDANERSQPDESYVTNCLQAYLQRRR
jgi:hypothetical protein